MHSLYTVADLSSVLHAWRFRARPAQLPPTGQWSQWLYLGGRGAGKTRAAAEYIRGLVERGEARQVHLIGRTPADVRDVMIDGESGLLRIYADNDPWRPTWIPSRRSLVWPNGARALTFSAFQPEALRGPQCDGLWADEMGSWERAAEAWSNALLGLRLGKRPRAVITTTPRPTPTLKRLIEDAKRPGSGVVVTRSTTFDNLANLAPTFRAEVLARFEGTSLGRQELYAEMIEQADGALWTRDLIERTRVQTAPPLTRIVVAVDPATAEGGDKNDCGIVAAGVAHDGHVYVSEDATVKGTPDKWARAVVDCYNRWSADRVVAEGSQGSALVKLVLQTVAPNLPIKMVVARRGKSLRGEPCVALFEQSKVHHVGNHPALEDEMCTWVDTGRASEKYSPNRMDALVYAITELALTGPQPAQVIKFRV